MSKFKQQVTKQHYQKDYDTLSRFIGYFHQIDIIQKLKPVTSILEVGIGNKTVSNYLNNKGYVLTTCDFAEDLKPDVVADVRKLPFKPNSFDVVMCCEVLEHIPLKDLNTAVQQLIKVAKKYVLISIPYYSAYFEFKLKFSIGHWKWGKYFSINVPYFLMKPKFTGEHYWGLGIKGISKSKFRDIFKKNDVKIISEFKEKYNPHHYYFLVEKKII